MKVIHKVACILAVTAIAVGCQSEALDVSEDSQDLKQEINNFTPGPYIIQYNDIAGRLPVLDKPTSPAAYKSQMADLKLAYSNTFAAIGLEEKAIFQAYGHSLKGFAANLTSEQLNALNNDSRVLSIEKDEIIALAPGNGNGPGGGGGGGSDPAQQVSYGTTRVGGGNTTSSNTAWVIDSGIDMTHPDLNVDAANSISFLSGSPTNQSPNDQNGHGTHVAGTIAAKDNSIGSLGVAPGSLVAAVRVLDRRGSGSTSGVIAGVDYVAANAGSNDVANMSLGGGVSTSLDNAVIAASSSCAFVLAAGNESDNANNHSPARANGNNIYTISAMNSSDNWASFSNYGSAVDYCAPGVGIFSTWKGGGYNTISGTSMAAPHAAGVLLLGNASSDGTVNGDPDGNPDPIIHI